jgi:hypothetical protein
MSASAAEPPTSPTPILDRQSPLPPHVAPTSRARLLSWIGLLIFAAITFAFTRATFVPSRRQEIQFFPDLRQFAGIAYLWLVALLVAFAVVAVHETGHVLGGLCAGFRFNFVRIGPLIIRRGFPISLYLGSDWWLGGATGMSPVSPDRLAARAMALASGGPTASILAGCAVLLLPAKGFAAWWFGIASVVGGLADLVPFRTQTVVSDGARIAMLLRDRARGERWLALLRLGADLTSGVPPESLPADYLAKAVAVRDHSADTVVANAFAYSAAFHQQMDVEAGNRLETCLTFSSCVVPAMREALASDAAVFQARSRKRPDLAEEWLTAIPATRAAAWLRSRAEAAVLEARGDIEGSLRKLNDYETAIRALPDVSQREGLLHGLRRWRTELQATAAMP